MEEEKLGKSYIELTGEEPEGEFLVATDEKPTTEEVENV